MHALANRHLTPHSHPYAVVFKDRVTPCCMHPTGIHLLLVGMPTGDKKEMTNNMERLEYSQSYKPINCSNLNLLEKK
jgi:hypothetical protein